MKMLKTKQQRKRFAICVLIVFGGVWLLLLMSVLLSSKEPKVFVTGPGVSFPPKVFTTPATDYRAPRLSFKSVVRHNQYVHASSSYNGAAMPKATMSSTSAIKVYTTSSATVNNVGSGNATSGGNAVSSTSIVSRVQSSAIAYTGAIYVPTLRNAVTPVGATQAAEVTSSRSALPSRRTTDDGQLPGYNEDPEPDEEIVPIGNGLWALLLLALGYGAVLLRRKGENV